MSITNSELALRIAELVDRWDTRENQMILMLTQAAGDVTVTDGLGNNHSLPSFPQLQLEVTQLVADAAGAVGLAYGHANTALQHRNAAGDYAAAAETAAGEAQEALSGALQEASGLTAAALAARDAAASSASAAASSATAASGSADTANTHKNAATASAAAAADSETDAGSSAASAVAQAGIASAAKVSSEVARDKAALWASAPVNTVVEGGEYSAKHYAAQAAAAALGSLVYMGTWSAAGGTYPPSPTKGHFYKIGTAGTISGTSYGVGDQIVHNGTDWDKIDNTDAVSSVAGKSGAVTLVYTDVGGLGSLAVRNDVDWTSHVTGKPAAFTPSAHNHSAGDINSGTFADARIAQSSVVQHQAALALSWSQVSSGKPTTLAGYGITDAFLSSGGNITGPVTFTAAGVRIQGHQGNAAEGVLYLGNGDDYVYKYGSTFIFKVGGATSTLTNAGGTILTTANAPQSAKQDARDSLGVTAAYPVGPDWNNATTNGWHMAQPEALNGPDANWYIGQVTAHNSLWIQQEVQSFTEAEPRVRYRRSKQNGVWSAWTADRVFGEIKAGTGVDRVVVGKLAGASGWAGIRHAAIAAPDTTNYAVIQNPTGSSTYVNATSEVALRVGNVGILGAGSTGLTQKNANSTTMTRIPRIFVGGSDPGDAAADGDLWIT